MLSHNKFFCLRLLFVEDTIKPSEEDLLGTSIAFGWLGLIINHCLILIDKASHLTALCFNVFILTASNPPSSILVSSIEMTVESSQKVVLRTGIQDWSFNLCKECRATAFLGANREAATGDLEKTIMLVVPILTPHTSYCLVVRTLNV